MRGARRVPEYTQLSEMVGLPSSLLNDASYGEALRPTFAEKSKIHRDITSTFASWAVRPPLHGSRCSSLSLRWRLLEVPVPKELPVFRSPKPGEDLVSA